MQFESNNPYEMLRRTQGTLIVERIGLSVRQVLRAKLQPQEVDHVAPMIRQAHR